MWSTSGTINTVCYFYDRFPIFWSLLIALWWTGSFYSYNPTQHFYLPCTTLVLVLVEWWTINHQCFLVYISIQYLSNSFVKLSDLVSTTGIRSSFHSFSTWLLKTNFLTFSLKLRFSIYMLCPLMSMVFLLIWKNWSILISSFQVRILNTSIRSPLILRF